MKRTVCLLLCAVMLIASLCACGKNRRDSDKNSEFVYDTKREALDRYLSVIDSSGKYAVITEGRLIDGKEKLDEFYADICAGKPSILNYTIKEHGEAKRVNGAFGLLDPENERRIVGEITFDGEAFYANITNYFPEKKEYSFTAAHLEKGVYYLSENERGEYGFDRMEYYYLTDGTGEAKIGRSADQIALALTDYNGRVAELETLRSENGLPAFVAAVKFGWGEEKRLSADMMRFPTDADIGSVLKMLKNEGYTVIEDGECTSGYDRLVEFYEKTNKGKKDTLKYATYYPADPNSNEADSLFIRVVDFNGEFYTKITRGIDSNEIDPPSRFRYLKRETEKMREGARHNTAEHFYFVNDKRKNWKDIERAMVSSDSSVAFGFAWGFMTSIYYD